MKIHLAQLSHERGAHVQNRCFPLAAGYLAAYLEQEGAGELACRVFKRPSEWSRVLARELPDVAMLSAYMWNEQLALSFARAIKAREPRTLVIVGGPNQSLDRDRNAEFLRAHPEIDILVEGEGEAVAAELMRAYLGDRSIERLKALRTPHTLALVEGEPLAGDRDAEYRIGLGVVADMDALPSPYLSGHFDAFFQDGELPLLETNRGCPFRCAFCQQGEDYFNRVRHFSTERFRAEMEYIARRMRELDVKLAGIEIADPNFAMYKRDAEITEVLARIQRDFGFPHYVGCSTGKNRPELIIENTRGLAHGSLLLRSAMQSLHPPTLEAIRRKNIALDAYRSIQREMDRQGLENNADLMLGLPLETRESHVEGILELVDAGIREFSCLQTIVLKGTEMEREAYRERYGIRTRHRVIPECCGTYETFGERETAIETEEIVLETSTLSGDDYLACRRVHYFVMLFHNTRLLAPVYALLDALGIARSGMLRALLALEGAALAELVTDFLEDTRRELAADPQEFAHESDLDARTHNKIFKHLAIAFFEHRDVVVDAVSRSLRDVLGAERADEAEELSRIVAASIIPASGEARAAEIELESPMGLELFGARTTIEPSAAQLALLEVVGGLYRTRDDRINKMAYHLRPGNLVMKLNSIL